MTETGTAPGISSAAVQRAADAMLRALGGCEVYLVLPLLTLPNDPSAQLGLVDPGEQQIALSPVVVRDLAPTASGAESIELLISASAVAGALISQNVASAEDLFGQSIAIVFDNRRFHIQACTPQYFGGAACMYKVTAVQ